MVAVAPELDVTVNVTEQRPIFTAVIFVLDALQSFDDVVETEAFIDSPPPVVNPAAAAALIRVIDVPRFTEGEPTMFTVNDFVIAFPFFGVIVTFTMHLPGATAVILVPVALHTDINELDIDPVTLEPFETEIFAALISADNDDVASVLIEGVFAIITGTVVFVVVGVVVVVVVGVVVGVVSGVVDGVDVVVGVVSGVVEGVDVVGVVSGVVDVVGAVGDPVTALEAGDSPTPFTALMVTEYVVPFVRPLMVNGLDVVAGFSAM